MTRHIGIDASKNGTAVCVKTDKWCYFYTLTAHISKKITNFTYTDNGFTVVVDRIPDEWKELDDFECLKTIADKIFSSISNLIDDNTKFYFEGYSMAGSGRITMLAELTSLLKNHIYNSGCKINGIYAPSSVKKHVGGKGNLKKDEIYERAWDDEDLNKFKESVAEQGHGWKNNCWMSDVLDSWAVCQMGIKSENGEIK